VLRHIVVGLLVLIAGGEVAERFHRVVPPAETVTVKPPSVPDAVRQDHPEEGTFQGSPHDVRPLAVATGPTSNVVVSESALRATQGTETRPLSGDLVIVGLVALAVAVHQLCVPVRPRQSHRTQ